MGWRSLKKLAANSKSTFALETIERAIKLIK